jgi:dTDP-4-dehydrorhamnose reductase
VSGSPARPGIELWGGIECTVNRVGERYFDQLSRCGHSVRLTDIDAIADLGIRVLRYPLLWERTAPNGLHQARWVWADERMSRLRARGVEPIVGLLHHGSGPPGTSLVDPGFPEALARYAAAVARRYPWVQRWTPINEPLTTARFSTLYGCWYPHARDERLFARALINQCVGIARAMRVIRAEIPGAQLVQTEDLGKVHGTPMLRYQVDFENERRWLTFDLLCGRVDRTHSMWDYLRYAGIPEDELERLLDQACPPDLLGINYYVTSERWLDERMELYPPATHGGNARHGYADVEAVRVLPNGTSGAAGVLGEAWTRYGRPLAVTEAHLGGAREQQLRWLDETWRSVSTLRARGADVRAVTVWSLLGAYDWHNLVTRDEGHYEPGAFDVRAARPRPTALARMTRELATTGTYTHPVLATGGWWRCDKRLLHRAPSRTLYRIPDADRAPSLLVTGSTGTLGRAFGRVCAERELPHRLVRRQEMELSDAASVARVLDTARPWAVVNAAGYVRVDDAELDGDSCKRDNLTGPAVLAAACASRGIALLTFSSDLVFDGTIRTPYVESDSPRPLSAYGHSKAEAERRVLDCLPAALVVRTSAFFGPWDEHNFVTCALRALRDGIPVHAADDQIVSPTYLPDLVHASLDLLIDGERGVWHLANDGAVSWAELARQAAERSGLDHTLVVGQPGSTLGHTAQRPPYSALGSERGTLLPSFEHALARYLAAQQGLDPLIASPQSF